MESGICGEGADVAEATWTGNIPLEAADPVGFDVSRLARRWGEQPWPTSLPSPLPSPPQAHYTRDGEVGAGWELTRLSPAILPVTFASLWRAR